MTTKHRTDMLLVNAILEDNDVDIPRAVENPQHRSALLKRVDGLLAGEELTTYTDLRRTLIQVGQEWRAARADADAFREFVAIRLAAMNTEQANRLLEEIRREIR